jgi:hypothetical protein
VCSLVEITRFQLTNMTLEEKKIAEWFGLEIARLAVDSCYRALAMVINPVRVSSYQPAWRLSDL